jgi:hypothetical protein
MAKIMNALLYLRKQEKKQKEKRKIFFNSVHFRDKYTNILNENRGLRGETLYPQIPAGF